MILLDEGKYKHEKETSNSIPTKYANNQQCSNMIFVAENVTKAEFLNYQFVL